MSEPRSFRFARHFRWSMLGQLATAAVSFLVTPTLVNTLGLETYGLYLILQSLTSYLILAALGAGGTTVTLSATARADGDVLRLRQVLRYSLFLHGAPVLAAAAAAAFAARPLLSGVYDIPPHLLETGTRVVAAAAVGTVFFSLAQCASSALLGLQRFDAAAVIGLLQSGLTPVLAVLLVRSGRGVVALAAAYALVQALSAALAWSVLRSVLDEEATATGGAHSRLGFKGFVKWSLSQWLGQMSWIVNYQFDRIFAAQQVSLAGMTLYAVPAGLLQRLNVIPATFGVVAQPMLAEVRSAGDAAQFHRLYLRQFRLLLWMSLPGLVLLFALMPQFLSLWLGGSFGNIGVWPARHLVLAQAAALLFVLPGTAAAIRGKPWYSTAVTWAQALISVTAWYFLVGPYDLVGLGFGSLLAQALPAVFFIPWIHRKVLGLTLSDFLAEGVFMPASCAALMFAVVFPFHDRATSWPLMAGFCVGGLLVYAAATWVLMGSDDRALVRRYLKRSGA